MQNENKTTEQVEVRFHSGPFEGLVRVFDVPMEQYERNAKAGKLTIMNFTRKDGGPGEEVKRVEYALRLNEHFKGYGDAYWVVAPGELGKVP